jgi:hypothetical protein
MAYDEALAQRILEVIGDDVVDTMKMFGGLALLLDGNMAVGVSGDEVMVRVGLEGFQEAVVQQDVRPFEMSGKRMNGWVLVGGDAIAEEDGLARWVDVGMSYAGPSLRSRCFYGLSSLDGVWEMVERSEIGGGFLFIQSSHT